MPQHQGSAEHDFIFAAEVPIDPLQIPRALQHQCWTAPAGTRISVLDIYCRSCRRRYVDVVGDPCICADNRQAAFLTGGQKDVRKKRRPLPEPITGAVVIDTPPTRHPWDRPRRTSNGL